MLLPHKKYGDTRKLWDVLDKSITLFVVMLSLVFAYVQSHYVIYIFNMCSSLCISYTSIKCFLKKRKQKNKGKTNKHTKKKEEAAAAR